KRGGGDYTLFLNNKSNNLSLISVFTVNFIVKKIGKVSCNFCDETTEHAFNSLFYVRFRLICITSTVKEKQLF
ncbi:TPA: hypothetical protein ACVOZD_004498, partial [Vibrio diabolicus]